MPRKVKNEDHINKKGNLSSYSESVSDFLDGKGRMLYPLEGEWVRALFLFMRIVEDRDGESEPALDELVSYARQIGTSAMIKRVGFDEAVTDKLLKVGIGDDETQCLLDALSDKWIKRVADAFDVKSGELSDSEHSVRMANAHRAIRSCVPAAGSRANRGFSEIDLPRSAAGIMAAVCLARCKFNARIAAPVCGNCDAVLGVFDSMSLTGQDFKPTFTASVPDRICSVLCKMSHIAAGYQGSKVNYLVNNLEDNPVPMGFDHASYDAVLVSSKPVITQAREYTHEHSAEDGKFVYDTITDGSLTDPYPVESGRVLSHQFAIVRFCYSLLSKRGSAAIWVPSRENRSSFSREVRKQILEENLLDTVIEFRQLSSSSPWLNDPISLWILRRGRTKEEPILLALLDGEGFDAFCGGSSSSFYANIDKALEENSSAQKVVKMILGRVSVDRCATLVSPESILQNDSFSFRFIDYASNIDIAANLASDASWNDLVKRYEDATLEARDSDGVFLAALKRFDKLIEKGMAIER